MQTVVPNYYAAFRCIGGKCRHNCCIGWEIDVDDSSLSRYLAFPEPWRTRFSQVIDTSGVPHFIIDENERCPFLNSDNLCEIQRGFGEHQLCDICREHPRFHNALPDRTESGLGLCCEAAAALILGQIEPVTLCGALPSNDEIILKRDRVIALLQDRTHTIPERCAAALAYSHTAMPNVTPAEWASVLLSLERLDDAWGLLLGQLHGEWQTADLIGFDSAMTARQTEYEQLLVYLVYRHAANASDLTAFAARVCFAVLGYTVIHALGAVLWTKNGRFTFKDQCELARIFSAELEYSDENLDILWETLEGTHYGGCCHR